MIVLFQLDKLRAIHQSAVCKTGLRKRMSHRNGAKKF